jgi:hypothetical protein
MGTINKIIVLGGGTSGLMSALMLKTQFEHLDVTVIESSTVGTIGVGEGATEHWKNFCEVIGVKLEDTMIECNATLKSAIKFTDWGVPDYYHATCEPYARTFGEHQIVYAKMIADGDGPLDIVQKRVIDSVVPREWSEGKAGCPVNQFHFNTFATNDYLHKLCKERNIPTIDDKILEIELDSDGNIQTLVGTNNSYNADFFVDSTGFARVLMNKLGAEWISYKDNLWVNSAIAFPTEDTDEYPIYTNATAMDAGWMWNTPVRGRWGNGYVFCDRYINFDQAHAEVEARLGRKVEIAKKIKFDAGKLDRSWIKNCASVGLSSSFIEPMESSAISQTVLQTFLIMNLLPSWVAGGDEIAEIYNNKVTSMCKNILDFVSVHYCVPKDNTAFWKDLKENRDQWMTDSLKSNLKKWSNRLPLVLEFDTKYELFTADNWIVTLHGLELLNVEKVKESYNMMLPSAREYCDAVVNEQRHLQSTLPHVPHKQAVELFIKNYKEATNVKY